MRSSGRGFTLFEALVAAALTLTLFSLLFTFLVPALHAYLRGTTRVRLQQAAMMAMSRMAGDLQSTTPLSVSVALNPTVLGMNCLRDVTDTGAQVWAPRVVVYALDARARTLLRIECPPAPPLPAPVTLPLDPGRPCRLTATDLRAIVDAGGGIPVATDVEAFEVSGVDGVDGHETDASLSTTDPLILTLRMARKEAHQQAPEQFVLRRTVSLRQRL